MTGVVYQQVTDIGHAIDNGGVWPCLVVVPDMPGRGRGVVATRVFDAGDVVCHYNGKLLDDKTGKRRYEASEENMGFMYSFRHKGKNMWPDATDEQLGQGRLINHSRCHPNVSSN